ncbi:MAG: DUF480 domain-containing protein [Ketobacteraceae bacterium]|nr:DUF480 domain-containing protein [Ketobacteraceae bacterium]
MALKFTLDPLEQRVLGCLIEKEITTPEHYPLSLNALTNACNQKSNREPVMSLSEAEVQDTLSRLKEKRLIASETGYGSRVVKYRHRFCNTEFGDFRLTDQELGILCVLFLRGPQTPGELRTRTSRLCEFEGVAQVEEVLQNLENRNDGALVVRLPREAGKRESRFMHTLGTEPVVTGMRDQLMTSLASSGEAPAAATEPGNASELEARVSELEGRVNDLEERLRALEQG